MRIRRATAIILMVVLLLPMSITTGYSSSSQNTDTDVGSIDGTYTFTGEDDWYGYESYLNEQGTAGNTHISGRTYEVTLPTKGSLEMEISSDDTPNAMVIMISDSEDNTINKWYCSGQTGTMSLKEMSEILEKGTYTVQFLYDRSSNAAMIPGFWEPSQGLPGKKFFYHKLTFKSAEHHGENDGPSGETGDEASDLNVDNSTTVFFGNYYQELITDPGELEIIKEYESSNSEAFDNGKEVIQGCHLIKRNDKYYMMTPIEWRVLKDNGNTYTLLSEKVIERRIFGGSAAGDGKSGWPFSQIREWLNNDFYNEAFSDLERNEIVEITNENKILNMIIGKGYFKESESTEDKVWLLDENEVCSSEYGFEEAANISSTREAEATQYVDDNEGLYEWYLRGDPYWFYYNAYSGKYVETTGKIHEQGSVWDGSAGGNYEKGIRPAIVVNKRAVSISKPKTKRIRQNKNLITEEMLYGEYNAFLKNKTYINMVGTLYDDMFAGMANRLGWMDWLSEAKNATREGLAGSLVYITKDRIGASEKEMQKELAANLIKAVGETDNLADYIDIKKIKTWNSLQKKYASTLLKTKPSVYEAQQLAKAFAPEDKKKQEQIVKNIQYFSAHDKEIEKAAKVFKVAGKTLGVADVVISAYVIQETDSELVDKLYGLVDHSSDLGKGLRLIKADQDKGFTITFVRNFINKVLIEGELASKIVDDLIIKQTLMAMSKEKIVSESISGAFGAAEAFWWGVSYLMPGKKADDVVEAWEHLANARTLSAACSNYRSAIAKNWDNGGPKTYEEMRSDYSLLIEAYKCSLVSGAEKVIDCAPSKEKKKIREDLSKYKNKIEYEKYIQSCLKNANTSYSVTQKRVESEDGMSRGVVIDEVYIPNSISEEDYIDIPDEIDGMPVVGIGNGVFMRRTDITAVTLPEALLTIDSDGFNECTSLDTVYFGSNIQRIGDRAFRGCKSLENIDIPDSTNEIGLKALDTGIETTIEGAKGLEADKYADENNLLFVERGRKPVSIEVIEGPNKTQYRVDESVDKTGIKIKATYADGTEEIITEGIAVWHDSFVPGSNSITIAYGDCTSSADVTVTEENCQYTIFYVDEYGEEIAEEDKGTAAGGSTVVTRAKSIEGYRPYETTQELTIGADNRISFVYFKDSDNDISNAKIQIGDSFQYSGRQIKPNVRITLGNSALEEGTDYELYFGDNVKDNGYVIIEGKGDYEGIIIKDFNIVSSNDKHVRSISLSAKPSVNISAGKKVTITAIIAPNNAANKNVSWTSSNGKYATVNAKGVVTTKKAGKGKSVVITATAKDGSGVKSRIKINLKKGVVKKISVKGKKTVKAGKSTKVKSTVRATKGANKKVMWTSSNSKYATVNAKGVVKTKKTAKGKTVKITAIATDGSGKKASIRIKIK